VGFVLDQSSNLFGWQHNNFCQWFERCLIHTGGYFNTRMCLYLVLNNSQRTAFCGFGCLVGTSALVFGHNHRVSFDVVKAMTD